MTNAIEMKSITKRFGSFTANNSINFTLKKGETHAIVGENGAGKTTLMRILYGQYTADEGKIYVNDKEENYNVSGALKLGIGMVHQNFMQIDKMTIAENIILGHAPEKGLFIDYKTAKKKVSELLKRLLMKVSPDTPISRLCVGERQRIEIIKALYLGANVLILDEPTAVLTPQETKELFSIIDELKKEGKSIIFISHKLREVIEVADRITVMRRGEVVADFDKALVDETDIARAMIGKQDVDLLQNTDRGKYGNTIFKAINVWNFDEYGIPKLKNFNLDIKEGEILGIGGVEGNGQTELINSIIGMYTISSGKIELDNIDISKNSISQRRKLGVGYISEDRMTTGLALSANMNENIICGNEVDKKFSKCNILKHQDIWSFSEDLIEKYDIRGINASNPVKQLSGGNMQKIVLAREISRNPKLLIAAQPTRGLDIGAINFVRKNLLEQKKKGTAIILVSADLEELMSLSDRIIIMYEGESAGEISTDEIKNNSVTEEEIGMMMGGVKRNERV